jgi:hypothetical protein
MRINSKVMWGLAWAGLALIIAVPSADFLTNKVSGNASVITSTTEPVASGAVKTGGVTTTRTANGITITPAGTAPATSGNAVDDYLTSGKKLPDYISEDSVTAPVPTTQVAAIETPPVVTPAPVVLAPTPFPSWARPHAAPAPVVASTPDPVVIVDDNASAEQLPVIVVPDETRVANGGPVPPKNIPDGNWTDPDLADYLANQGLLDDDGSRATVVVTNPRREAATDNYDVDGFFLSDGPNGDRADQRRARLRALFGDDCYDEDTGEDLCDY